MTTRAIAPIAGRAMAVTAEVIVRQVHRSGQARLAEINAALGQDALNPRQLSRHLARLHEQGWIEKARGSTARTYWRPTPEALPLLRRPDALPTRPVASRFHRQGGRP